MPPHALRLSAVTLLGALAVGAAWWWLAPTTPMTETPGGTTEVPATVRPIASPPRVDVPTPAANEAADAEVPAHQALDGGTRTEILDRLEARDALRVGPDEAARLRANREQILDDRADYAEPSAPPGP